MPSGGNKRVTATLDIQAQITNYQESLNKLQGALGKLHLPDGLRKGFENLFIDYQRELDKLSKSSANNKLSVLNEKEIEKSFDRIDGLYSNLIKKLRSSGYEDSILESDFKVIEQMKAAQEEYSKAVKGSAAELEKEQKALDKIKAKLEEQKKQQKSLGSQKGGAATSQKYAQKAVEDTNKALQAQKEVVQSLTSQHKAQEKVINSATNAQKNALNAQANAERKLAAFREVNKGKTDDKSRERELNLIKEEEAATARVQKANEDLAAAKAQNLAIEQNLQKESAKQSALEAKANEAKTRNTEATRKLTSVTNSYNKKVEEVRQTEEQLGQQNKTVQEKQQAYESLVRDTLTKVVEGLKAVAEAAGIDVSQIKSIEDVNKALEDLGNEAKDRAAPAVEDVGQQVNEAGELSAAAKQKFLEAADGLHQLSERQKEVERLSQSVLRFFSIDNAVRLFKRAVRSAYETIKDLDAVMTETAVVTDFSVGDMWSQLPEYTKRANELGVSIHAVYEASTLYYQQGLKTNEVMAVTNATLRMARIAGLDAAEATDRVTNALRGFNMEINEANADRIADVYSKLAAISASNVDEISTAMTKVASLANSANMEFENTAAFLAQIIETTRESAETAGTALKTVIARFSEVKKLYSEGQLLGTDEEGEAIDVNKVSTALRTAGIDLNEFLTGAKGLDEVFVELASKWDSLDIVQQRYIATMAAGSRQQSRFIALMSDYQRTQELTAAAQNANGASMEQYEKTLDSLQSKLAQLENAWNEFTMSITNSELVKFFVDAGTQILNVINAITGAFGDFGSGFSKVLLLIGGIKLGKTIFSKLIDSVVEQFVFGGQKSGESFIKGFVKKADPRNLKGFGKEAISELDKSIIDAAKKTEPVPLVGNNGIIKTDLSADALKPYAESIRRQIAEYVGNDANLGAEVTKTFNEGLNSGKSANEVINEVNEGLKPVNANLKVTKDMAQQAGSSITFSFQTAAMAAGALSMIIGLVGTTLEQIGVDTKITNSINHITKALGVLSIMLTAMPALLNAIGKSGEAAWAKATLGLSLVISVAVALVGIYGELSESEKEYEERLKKQTQTARQQAEDAKKAYEDLLNGTNNYSKLTEELGYLTEGTQKWKEKLEEVNSVVLDLINNFPELAQYLRYDENGQLVISEQGLSEYEKNRKQSEKNANMIAGFNDFSQKYITYEESLGEAFEDLTKSDGILGNILASYDTSAFKNRDFYDLLLKIQETNFEGYNDEEISEWIREAGSFDLDVNTFKNLKGAISSPNGLLATFLERVRQGVGEAEGQSTLATTILSNIEPPKATKKYASDIVNGLTEAFAYNYAQEFNVATTKVEKFSTDDYEALIGKTYKGAGTDSKTVLRQAYADLIGKKVEDLTEIDDKTIQDYMRDYMALSPNINLVESILNNEQTAKLISGFLVPETGLVNELTNAELDNVKDVLSKNGLSEDMWDRLLENYRTTLTNLDNQYNNFQEELSDNVQNILKNDNSGKFTVSALYGKINKASAGTGTNSLINIINEVGDALPKEKFKDFIDVLNSADLSTWQGVQQVPKLLELAGINLEDFKIDLKDLTNRLVIAARAVRTFDLGEVKDQIKENVKLIESLKDRGSLNFTEEEYQNLLKSGANEADFVETDEGWRYIGGTMDNLILAIQENTSALKGEYNTYTERQEQSANTFKEIRDNAFNDTNNKQGLDEFLAGEVTGDAFKNALETAGIEQIIDSVTGEIFETSSLTQEKALQLYQQMYKDFTEESTRQRIDGEKPRGAEAIDNAAEVTEYTEDELQHTAEYIRDTHSLLEETAQVVVAANAKLNAGLSEIIGSYDEWIPLIDESTGLLKAGSVEDQKAIDKLKDSTKKMLNVDGDLSDAFWKSKENMDDLKLAAEGNTEALERLQKAAGMDYLRNLGLGESAQVDAKTVETIINDFSNWLSEVDLPELEAGVQWDDTGAQEFIKRMEDMAAAAGWSAEDIQKAVKAMGFDAEINMEETDRTIQIPYTNRIIDETDEFGPSKWHEETTWEEKTVHGTFPVIKTLTSTGSGGGGISYKNKSGGAANRSKGGGGGGSSSKSDKPKNWKNPYDELYNLTEQINENSRQRNLLEAEYDLMLNDRTKANDVLLKNSYEQLKNLEKELALQKQLQAGRKSQLDDILNETYEDSEGNRKTFGELGVGKYAHYDEESRTIVIDWEGLEALAAKAGSEEEGKAVEEYIKKLEELAGQFEEVDSKVLEIEKEVQDIRMRGMDKVLELQERVREAFIQARQDEIDELQAVSDTIEESTSRVIDGIREQVEAERQARENEKAEEDIADKEMRLAYLQRDTSGANDLEILKLNEELADARQDYTDSLIDQGIEKMQEQAEKAQQQRQKQIDLMTAQLAWDQKNGKFNEAVNTVLEAAFEPEGTFTKMATAEGDISGFLVAAGNGKKTFVTNTGLVLPTKLKDGNLQVTLPNGSTTSLTKIGDVQKGIGGLTDLLGKTEGKDSMTSEQRWMWESKLLEDIKEGTEGWANFKVKQAEDAGEVYYGKDGKGGHAKYDSTNKRWIAEEEPKKGNQGGGAKNYTYKDAENAYSGNIDKDTKYDVPTENAMMGSQSALKSMFTKGKQSEYVKDSYGNTYAQRSVYNEGERFKVTIKRKLEKKYKSGGLVDFTGPAWLDGTKTKPEIVLNQADSQNFIILKDILSQLLRNPIQSGSQGAGGDNYYEINIDAEIANDYDVDRLASRIKQQIYSDGMYRNVNTLNWQR